MAEGQGGSDAALPGVGGGELAEPALGAGTAVLGVVIVDDSPAHRRFLRVTVEADGDFAVVGEARNGKEAVALVARLRPAAVLLDLELPVMSGLEAVERIMAVSPTPILVWSAHVPGEGGVLAAEVMAAGAVGVVAKPDTADPARLVEYAVGLRRRLRVAARIRVITHPRGRLDPSRAVGLLAPPPPVTTRPLTAACTLGGADAPRALHAAAPISAAASVAVAGAAATRVAGPAARPLSQVKPALPRYVAATGSQRSDVRLVVVGASTGGPQALLTVLGGLPRALAAPVLVVQHMAAGFLDGLAGWLDEQVALTVRVGRSGDRLTAGTVTLAPTGGNFVLLDDRLRVASVPAEVGQHHVPGIDVTLRSVADVLGPRALGVLLTGMGRDGAAGLLCMRERGAMTLAQDEATSAVYGMPAAAVAAGAASQQLAVADIAAAVLATVARPRP